MRDDIYQGVVSEYNLAGKTVHTWHINDVASSDERDLRRYGEVTLATIARNVDELLAGLGLAHTLVL
jgi:hypothetical protein